VTPVEKNVRADSLKMKGDIKMPRKSKSTGSTATAVAEPKVKRAKKPNRPAEVILAELQNKQAKREARFAKAEARIEAAAKQAVRQAAYAERAAEVEAELLAQGDPDELVRELRFKLKVLKQAKNQASE